MKAIKKYQQGGGLHLIIHVYGIGFTHYIGLHMELLPIFKVMSNCNQRCQQIGLPYKSLLNAYYFFRIKSRGV